MRRGEQACRRAAQICAISMAYPEGEGKTAPLIHKGFSGAPPSPWRADAPRHEACRAQLIYRDSHLVLTSLLRVGASTGSYRLI